MPDNAGASYILESLRTHTRAVHQRLHQHPITRNLVRKSLTLEQYVTALYAFDRFHEMIESEYEQKSFPDFNPEQLASSLIKRDYLTLTGNTSNPLPPCPPLNLEQSADAGLGLVYVVEGARQGGSIIARNLASTLDLDAGHGAGFFTRGNNKAQADWNSFIVFLNEQCTDSQLCCDTALSTFERLESYLWSAQQALPISIKLTESA